MNDSFDLIVRELFQFFRATREYTVQILRQGVVVRYDGF